MHERIRAMALGQGGGAAAPSAAAEEEQLKHVQCPNCLQGYEVPESQKEVTCEVCGETFSV